MSTNHRHSLKLLPGDIWRRLKTPFWSATFWTHLLVVVGIAGGIGIWWTLGQCYVTDRWDKVAIAAAIYTYFPAIVAPALLDMINEHQRYLRSFGIAASAILLVILACAALTAPKGNLTFGIVGSVLSIAFWWIANGEKDCFKDIDPEAPTPRPNRPLKGNKSGFQT